MISSGNFCVGLNSWECWRVVTGGSACWGNGECEAAVRFGEFCFTTQQFSHTMCEKRPIEPGGRVWSGCERKHTHRAEFPSLRLRRTEPLPQHAEPPITAREHPNCTENFYNCLVTCKLSWYTLAQYM